MRARAVLAVALAALAAPASAGAAVEISHLFDENGDPALIANAPTGFTSGPSWRVCAPDCGPTVPSATLFEPGPTAVGTTFEATGADASGAVAGRSRPWLGRPTIAAPPTISGTAAIGQSVTASPGTWTAGWGDDISVARVQACPTTTALDCVLLSQGPGPVVVDQIYTGWYLGAVDSRYGSGQAFTAEGWIFRPGFLSQYKAPAPGQLVAAGALIGPVPAEPKGSPPADDGRESAGAAPGTKPSVTFRKHARRSGRRLVLGTIRCKRCVAKVVVRQGRADVAARLTVSSTRTITVAARRFRSRVRVFRIVVGYQDSTVVVKGRVKAR